MQKIAAIIKHLWASRKEFAKYFIIGISAVALDVASVYFLKNFLQVRPVWAVVINQPFLLVYVFCLNKFWAFKSTGMTHKQMVRFLIVAGMNYGIAAIWMWFFTEILVVQMFGARYDYLLVRMANVALAVAWNFLLYKHWVYKII